jgi:hypothetical protein
VAAELLVEQFPATKLPFSPIELRTTSRHPGDMPSPPRWPPDDANGYGMVQGADRGVGEATTGTRG